MGSLLWVAIQQALRIESQGVEDNRANDGVAWLQALVGGGETMSNRGKLRMTGFKGAAERYLIALPFGPFVTKLEPVG